MDGAKYAPEDLPISLRVVPVEMSLDVEALAWDENEGEEKRGEATAPWSTTPLRILEIVVLGENLGDV